MIWRFWVQTPLGAIFDEIYFVLCNFRSVRLSDRKVSVRPIVKNMDDPGLVEGMVGTAPHFKGDKDRQSAEFGLVP